MDLELGRTLRLGNDERPSEGGALEGERSSGMFKPPVECGYV